MSVIETANLTKTYRGKIEAVKNLNMRVERGQVYGLLGPNGAGKSTTMRILLGILKPTAGTFKFFDRAGIDLNRVGYLPEDANYYRFMRVEEYLGWTCSLYDSSGDGKRVASVLESVGMTELKDRKIDRLSKGQKQRVGLAQALVHDPDVLILDEPTSGLDPVGRKNILEIVDGLSGRGKTILVSSHILPELSRICTAVGIINNGELVLQGTMSELQHKFQTSRLEIEFEELDERLISTFGDYPWVRSVEKVESEDNKLVIIIQDKKRAKREILTVLANSDSIVTYYNFSRLDLEEIFLNSVEGGRNEISSTG